MKKFICGLLLGLVLTTTSYAAIEEFILYKADYDIVVDGVVYSDEELPTLNYQGNTYIPLRNVANMLQTEVNWNAELRQVEIGEVDSTSVIAPTYVISEDEGRRYFDNDIEYIEYNDKKYIESGYVSKQLRKFGYKLLMENAPIQLTTDEKDPKIIYDEIDFIRIKFESGSYSSICIDYTFYIENIMPLINDNSKAMSISSIVNDEDSHKINPGDARVYFEDDIPYLEYNNKKYIDSSVLFTEDSNPLYDENNETISLEKISTEEIIIKNIPYVVRGGAIFIEYEFYLENIKNII